MEVSKGVVVQEDMSRDQVNWKRERRIGSRDRWTSGERRLAFLYGINLYCKSAWWSAQRCKYKHRVQDGVCTEVRDDICTTQPCSGDGVLISGTPRKRDAGRSWRPCARNRQPRVMGSSPVWLEKVKVLILNISRRNPTTSITYCTTPAL
jgi:hypothetical protein